jgi:hypothetical protein
VVIGPAAVVQAAAGEPGAEAAEQPLRGGEQPRVVVVQHRWAGFGGDGRGHRMGKRTEPVGPQPVCLCSYRLALIEDDAGGSLIDAAARGSDDQGGQARTNCHNDREQPGAVQYCRQQPTTDDSHRIAADVTPGAGRSWTVRPCLRIRRSLTYSEHPWLCTLYELHRDCPVVRRNGSAVAAWAHRGWFCCRARQGVIQSIGTPR